MRRPHSGGQAGGKGELLGKEVPREGRVYDWFRKSASAAPDPRRACRGGTDICPSSPPVLGTRIGRSVPWRPRLADYVTSWMTLIGAPMREYPYPMETMSGTVEKNMSIVEDVPSINYHIWKPCNMSCRFCFATFQDVESVLPKGHLRREGCRSQIDIKKSL